MEKIGEKFKEKISVQPLVYIMIFGFAIILALVWTICASYIHENCCKCTALIINAIFFILLILGTVILFWKVYKKEVESREKTSEFNRKIDWEEFQKKINELDNERRFDFEKEKYVYEKIKEISQELNKQEKIVDEKIENLKTEIENIKNKKEAHFIVELKKDNL